MKIILNKNVQEIGSVGQIIDVKDGYARNFLFPRGLATLATPANIKQVEHQQSKAIAKEKEIRGIAEGLAQKISVVTLTLEANVGDEEKLYGSVTGSDVQELLAKQGIEIDKKDVLIKTPIRKTGSYPVEIRCHTGVRATLKLQVVRKKD